MKHCLLILGSILFAVNAYAQVSISIDPSVTYQTIEGWGHGGGVFSSLNYDPKLPFADSINDQYLDQMVDDLGLTGSRTWEVGPRLDGTGMDNGDCDSIDWSKFEATSTDTSIARYANYFNRIVAAQGLKTNFYSSPTYPTIATALKPWVLNHPGERAQQIWANALWWKSLGIDIDYDVIYNEPNGAITPLILADDIKALGPRLLALGLATRSQYAEAVAPQTDWNFISAVAGDSELWKYVGRISYHNYGTADPYRAELNTFAQMHGIPTAQTEMGNPTIDDLFNDLILGGVTYWEIGFSGSSTLVPAAGNISWTPSATYYRLRQLLHYVRPGATRIGATANDTTVRVLAFVRNKLITTVLLNLGSQKSATISGLVAGKYGVAQSVSGASAFTELGIQIVGADGKLTVALTASGTATTIYPYVGGNHPPTIMSESVTPGYLVLPATSATIAAKVNDPERDPLTYQWSIASEPVGANAVIATPTLFSSTVTGMSLPGMYVFAISASDGSSVSTKKVYLQVYSSDPPPNLWQLGFRFAAPYGLVFGDPASVTHANVELPTSTATLQVGVSDLANSNFTGRGKWTLVSQPPGASVKLDTTIYIYISIRAQVSNMTVPGDYVFQVNVSTPGKPDLVAREICTVHPASAGPIISSISALPLTLTLPLSAAQLSAATSDPESQLLRHWWYIKSAPVGSRPVFDHQGLPSSHVSGLTIPGSYVFTLRTFDDIHMTTKDIAITVQKSADVTPPENVSALDLSIYPNPTRDKSAIRYSLHDRSDVSVDIFNALGEHVRCVYHGMEPEGRQSHTFDLTGLPAGEYYIRFTVGGQTLTRPILIE